LSPIEHIARRHRISPYPFDIFFQEISLLASLPTLPGRGSLFLMMLYVNLYCGRVLAQAPAVPRDRRAAGGDHGTMQGIVFNGPEGLIQCGTVRLET
jgi:hypothetical protein